MAIKEYVGAAFVEIDSRDYDVQEFEVRTESGYISVKTMNRSGKTLGVAQGIVTYTISLTAAIPKDEDIDWAGIKGAKFTHEPVGGGRRTSYLDCVCTEVSEKYTVDTEAKVDATFISTTRVKE